MKDKNKPNIIVIASLFLMAFFLYSQNNQLQNLNNRLTDVEEKRLKLIEDKFGGEKSLKCSESETVKKIRSSIVRVIGGEAEGSGFVIVAKNNCHSRSNRESI